MTNKTIITTGAIIFLFQHWVLYYAGVPVAYLWQAQPVKWGLLTILVAVRYRPDRWQWLTALCMGVAAMIVGWWYLNLLVRQNSMIFHNTPVISGVSVFELMVQFTFGMFFSLLYLSMEKKNKLLFLSIGAPFIALNAIIGYFIAIHAGALEMGGRQMVGPVLLTNIFFGFVYVGAIGVGSEYLLIRIQKKFMPEH